MHCVAENKGKQSQQWKTNKHVSLKLKLLTFGDDESDICGWEGMYKQLHMDEIELISTQTSNITYMHILITAASTVEPCHTTTPLMQPPRYYDHFFVARTAKPTYFLI